MQLVAGALLCWLTPFYTFQVNLFRILWACNSMRYNYFQAKCNFDSNNLVKVTTFVLRLGINLIEKSSQMKTSLNNTYLNVSFAGYGHNKVTTTFRGKEVSMITTDTELTDKYRSDNERTSNAAKRELIRRTRAAYVATV